MPISREEMNNRRTSNAITGKIENFLCKEHKDAAFNQREIAEAIGMKDLTDAEIEERLFFPLFTLTSTNKLSASLVELDNGQNELFYACKCQKSSS
ncbi:MAG: hypothetical protein OWS74_08860 [Firmicutes bacterium]|nr:hypothetical protein [Bacillota bacterium]